jgi:pimeloyl-ACP methyl ester carboxylesterase
MNVSQNTSSSQSKNSTNVRSIPRSQAANKPRLKMAERASLGLLRTAIRAASLVSNEAGARVALEVFLRPRKFARPKAESRLLWMAEMFCVPLGDRNIPVWHWGTQGPAVILMHGWEGRGGQLGAFVSPLVEAGFQVFAFDAPGHGSAEVRRSSLPEFARALGAVQREVSKRVGHVYGIVAHSMGGAAAMLAEADALEAGESFAVRTVMIAPPGKTDSYTRLFSRIMGMTPDVTNALRKRIEAEFSFSFDAVEPWNLALRLKSQALIVHDGSDEVIPVLEGAELAGHLGGELMRTEGLGHRRILKDPAVVARTVEFLRAGATHLTTSPPLANCLERELFLRYERIEE